MNEMAYWLADRRWPGTRSRRFRAGRPEMETPAKSPWPALTTLNDSMPL